MRLATDVLREEAEAHRRVWEEQQHQAEDDAWYRTAAARLGAGG